MKKILLALLFAGCVLTGLVAQNLTLSDSAGSIPNNGERIFEGDPSLFTISSYAFVTNQSGSSMDVMLKKVEFSIPGGCASSFCWGACYPPNIFVSPTPVTIAAGSTNNVDFVGDYYPYGISGEGVVRYVFFNSANVNDSVCFNVKYDAFPVGVKDVGARQAFITASPNPASSSTTFTYGWTGQSVNATLRISNLVGAMVKEFNLSEKGKLTVDINDLPEGIYFYSFITGGKMIKTAKLIVQR